MGWLRLLTSCVTILLRPWISSGFRLCSSRRRLHMTTALVDDIREIKEDNPFESMMSRFDRAAQLLNLDPDLYAVMRAPNRELKVYITTRIDSGRIPVVEGFTVLHK